MKCDAPDGIQSWAVKSWVFVCSYLLTAAFSNLDIFIVMDSFVIRFLNVYILYRNKYSTSFNFVDLIRCAVFLHMHQII